jgi:hypothetical protein
VNDTRLAHAVRSGLAEARDSLSTVHMAIPASEIMARADEARRHRRLGVLAGAGGLAAVAVAASVALPASYPTASDSARGHGAHLAAWTVTQQANGNIQIIYREIRDAAGLQRVLRADGVPASVTFPGRENPACRNLPSPHPRWRPGLTPAQIGGPVYWGPHNDTPTPYALIIRRAALPSGVGVALFGSGRDIGEPYDRLAGVPVGLGVNLVRASSQCTGS